MERTNRCLLASAVTLALLAGSPPRGQAAAVAEARARPFGPGDRWITPLAGAPARDGVLAECEGREPTLTLSAERAKAFGQMDTFLLTPVPGD